VGTILFQQNWECGDPGPFPASSTGIELFLKKDWFSLSGYRQQRVTDIKGFSFLNPSARKRNKIHWNLAI